MINASEWSWVVNLDDMTCINSEYGVTIIMQKVGEGLKAVLHDMPMMLFAEISGYSDGEKIIEEIVRLAGEEYLRSKPRA